MVQLIRILEKLDKPVTVGAQILTLFQLLGSDAVRIIQNVCHLVLIPSDLIGYTWIGLSGAFSAIPTIKRCIVKHFRYLYDDLYLLKFIIIII